MIKRCLILMLVSGMVLSVFADPSNTYGKHYLVIVAEYWDGHEGDGIDPAEDVGLVDYLKWLRHRGYEVKTRVVDANCSVEDVKDIILDWYLDYQPATPRYVLLVGDAKPHNPDAEYREPDQGWEDRGVELCSSKEIATYGQYPYDNPDYPLAPDGANWSDYYFADFLDSYGDSKPDGYPEVALGRWCPHDDTELENIVRKQFAYERYAGNQTGWTMNQVAFIGETGVYKEQKEEIIKSDWWVDNDLVCHHLISEDSEQLNEFILSVLNNQGGVSLMNFRGHGNCYCWTPMTDFYHPFDYYVQGSSFADADIYDLLTNRHWYPLVFSICCLTGCVTDRNQDYQSMSEAWVNDQYGAVGAWGASRIVSTANNGILDFYLFKGLFDEKLGDRYPQRMDVGTAINFAKERLLEKSSAWALRDVRSYHWIGDPGLRPWYAETADSTQIWVLVIDQQTGDTLIPPDDHIPVRTPVRIEIRLGWMQNSDSSSVLQGPIVGAEIGLYKDEGRETKVRWKTSELSTWSGQFEQVGFAAFTDLVFDTSGDVFITVTNQQTWENPEDPTPSMSTPYAMKPVEVSVAVAESGSAEERDEPLGFSVSLPSLVSSQSIVLKYSIPEPGRVRFRIFDACGRQVRNLVAEIKNPGSHQITWDGCDAAGEECPGGLYFVQMQSDDLSTSQRIVLIR